MTYFVSGNGASAPRCLSGASISQLVRRMSPVERAILGAELVEGRTVLEPPTGKTAAALCQVSMTYVGAALKLSPDQRAAVLNGERPLIAPPRFCTTMPTEWDALVTELRLLGTDRALDAAIEAERAS
jgi:hypothetical protein